MDKEGAFFLGLVLGMVISMVIALTATEPSEKQKARRESEHAAVLAGHAEYYLNEKHERAWHQGRAGGERTHRQAAGLVNQSTGGDGVTLCFSVIGEMKK